MKILQISKYPPIQGGVSSQCFWLSRMLCLLGNQVTVVTNAQEVEEEYRINLSADDMSFISSGFSEEQLRIISSHADLSHRYIPKGNPTISKLVNLALIEVEKSRPDMIFSRYFEPYSVVGSLVSLYTGIGHVVAHAGSDVGRLLKSPALEATYRMLLSQAKAVMTNRAAELGITSAKQIPGHSGWLPTEFFYPRTNNRSGTFRFGIYGKTGRHKGCSELVEAMGVLKNAKIDFEVHAVWGGAALADLLDAARKANVADRLHVLRYMPHWKIADFITSCDAILFLENGFPIRHHTPQIPLEALSCGRPVLVTKEIYDKKLFQDFRDINCFSLVENPFNIDTLVAGMLKVVELGLSLRGRTMEWINVRQREEEAFWSVANRFDQALKLVRA